MDQWSLFIDIEGFGYTYSKGSQAIRSLGALMSAVYSLGSQVFYKEDDRIFAHQIGDGFIIIGDQSSMKRIFFQGCINLCAGAMRNALPVDKEDD